MRRNVSKNWRVAVVLSLAGLSLAGCASPRGKDCADQRAYVRRMHDDALYDLYRARPELRQRVEHAPGYAVFSNVDVHLIFSAAHGYGVVVDNVHDTETFMRMAELGLGFGAGLKDYRVVFIFGSDELVHRFADHGWEFGADTEAGLVAGDAGADISGQASGTTGGSAAGTTGQLHDRGTATAGSMEAYQLTKSGLVLQAKLAGTRYWKDAKLNNCAEPERDRAGTAKTASDEVREVNARERNEQRDRDRDEDDLDDDAQDDDDND